MHLKRRAKTSGHTKSCKHRRDPISGPVVRLHQRRRPSPHLRHAVVSFPRPLRVHGTCLLLSSTIGGPAGVLVALPSSLSQKTEMVVTTCGPPRGRRSTSRSRPLSIRPRRESEGTSTAAVPPSCKQKCHKNESLRINLQRQPTNKP